MYTSTLEKLSFGLFTGNGDSPQSNRGYESPNKGENEYRAKITEKGFLEHCECSSQLTIINDDLLV